MYSPRIKDSLVRRLYYLKLRTGKTMTSLVNEIIEEAIERLEQQNAQEDAENRKEATCL